jgi:hypothetical protein
MGGDMMDTMTSTTRIRQPRAQISITLTAKILDLLDQQAAALGVSRPRYIARLVQDRQQQLDIDHDMALLKELGPDAELQAVAEGASSHPAALGE